MPSRRATAANACEAAADMDARACVGRCVLVLPLGQGSAESLRFVRASLLLRVLRLVRLFRFSDRFRVRSLASSPRIAQ